MADTGTTRLAAEVTGEAHGSFAPLRDILPRYTPPAGGGALAVLHRGEVVADLAFGDYSRDALQLQFSVSKAVTAIAAAHAVAAGLLDLDRPLGAFWRAFARSSTRTVTTRMVLTHRSGLAGVSEPLTRDELVAGRYTDALERQEPFWEPGSVFGYHSFSFGPLMDGIFERQLGCSVAAYAEEHLRAPLGLDLWYGLPQTLADRLRPYTRPLAVETPLAREAGRLRTFDDRGAAALAADYALVNEPEVLAQTWPNCNVVATALSLGRLLAATLESAGSARILGAAAVAELTAPTGRGLDWVLRIPIAYGLGIQLPFPQMPLTGPRAFGHEGAGGCVAWADPDRELAVAYTTNVFPPCDGSSPVALALMSTIRQLHDEAERLGEDSAA